MILRSIWVIGTFISVVVLTGCAGMADSMDEMAGLGVIKEEKSTFDGATIISVSPTWLTGDPDSLGANSIKLGAQWSSNAPEYVVLVMQYNSSTSGYGDAYLNIIGLNVNIDGKVESFKPETSTMLDNSSYNSVSQTIYTESTNNVIVPLDYLKKMIAAEDCRLRVHTGKGYEDSIFSIERTGGGARTAKITIGRFIDKITEYYENE